MPDGRCLRSGPLVLRLETLVTTQNTHPENNDWQESAGEHLAVSETSNPPVTTGASLPEGQALTQDDQAGESETPSDTDASDDLSAPVASHFSQEEESFSIPIFTNQEAWLAFSEQAPVTFEGSFTTSGTSMTEQFPPADASPVQEEVFAESNGSSLFPLEGDASLSGVEEPVRPFTDFIEEFRQREVRLNALLSAPETSFTAFVAENELGNATPSFTEAVEDEGVQVADVVADVQEIQVEEKKETAETGFGHVSEESRPVLTQPALPAERPVSPLLRPATRIRLPRHSRHRVEELIQPAELQAEQAKAAVESPVEEKPAAAPQTEEQPARPARRYRFDRPSAAASTAAVPPPPALSKPQPVVATRNTGTREKREVSANTEPATSRSGSKSSSEAPAQKVIAQETVTAPTTPEVEIVTPAPSERRRRGNHERQREKEQPVVAQAAPILEVSVPEPEPLITAPAEVPLEDLPPLEYSELQAANSRRRRRRRVSSASSTLAATNGATPPKAVLPEILAPAPTLPTAVVPLPKSVPPVPPVVPPGAQNYNIVSGYTVSQMNQGNDASGPFMGPEPSPARGSTFSNPSTPSLRHVRSEALRSTSTHSAKHSESQLMSPASVSYLANTVTQAVQTQTDRMVAELRRANQVPTNVSVSLPPFPSTERVGVFVDVANLLYSARTLRMTVDFGKLLDFLRGNRRLVRAQAYCPTSPQPGDEQMFLQAVKGLGYRITTKNYKTFSSGAKKADLDLDLCMDVVRLVDGRAVDCIVLVSGDSDFMPMLDYCSDHGVRVEVAAFDESMSATLRQSCDLFVNLSMLEEIRL